MWRIVFCLSLVLPIPAMPLKAQTAYGSCPNTAQFYQELYQANGNAKDMACMQYALQRELSQSLSATEMNTSSEPNLPQPEAKQFHAPSGADIYELFCDRPLEQDGYESCVRTQTKAADFIAKLTANDNPNASTNRDHVSSCTHWLDAGELKGSMNIRDWDALARCASMTQVDAASLYRNCVFRITGQEPEENVILNFTDRESGRVQECMLNGLPKG